MRFVGWRVAVLVIVASCGGGSSPVPTPNEILADGVVTEAELLSALAAVQSCVEATGAEFSVEFDQRNTPR